MNDKINRIELIFGHNSLTKSESIRISSGTGHICIYSTYLKFGLLASLILTPNAVE